MDYNKTVNKSILVVGSSEFLSGAEKSLLDFLSYTQKGFIFNLLVPEKAGFEELDDVKIIRNPYFEWFHKTYNIIRLFIFTYYLLRSVFYLRKIIVNHNIDIIYCNTLKSALYGIVLKSFIKRKLVCHIRDNINSRFLGKLLVKKSDKIICISKHIYEQLSSNIKMNHLIYGGIDINSWKREILPSGKKNYFNFSNEPSSLDAITIASIGQLTKWKNQSDFIKVVKAISNKYKYVQFIVVGDDLSGREVRYKSELHGLVAELGLGNKVHFIGHKNEIKELMNQIDILIHPAINEPFGRVLIEAMAMEIPVVAYNCGGPAEIVLDGETGYLVDPGNYRQLAEKTQILMEDQDLRCKMGEAGRQRVIERFNIDRYVTEMDKVFEELSSVS